jgi:ferritin-like metal-binding protein YciE
MKKIIREVKILIKRTKLNNDIRDTALVLTGREIDHYAIAAYAGLVRLSTSLNLNKVSQSLYMAMEDEMNADSVLRDVTRSNFYSFTSGLKPVG